MDGKTGRATYRRGKLYFDEIGWAIVRAVARKAKKSPREVVIAAIKRYARLHKNEKAEKGHI